MKMRYMKASGFAIVTAVSQEPGQRSYSSTSVLNSIFNSNIHHSPLKQRKNPGLCTQYKHYMIFTRQSYNQTPCN